MAGGTFKTVGDKVLPGAYINVNAKTQGSMTAESDTGTVFVVVDGTEWGPTGITLVNSTSNFKAILGADITDSKLAGLYQALLSAPEAVVYNLNDGAVATASSATLPWDMVATYAGERGNELAVTITPVASAPGTWKVHTVFGGAIVDAQTVAKASDLQSNDFVNFNIKEVAQADDGKALLDAVLASETTTLSGGSSVDSQTLLDGLVEALQVADYDVATAAGLPADSVIHTALAKAVISIRENDGINVQAVVPYNANAAYDHEAVIVVANGFVLPGDVKVDTSVAAGYVAGASAAATTNQSLTYKVHPTAIDAYPRLTKEARISAKIGGRMVFVASRGVVKIESDINSLVTFTGTKSRIMSKNRVMRVLDDIVNNTRMTWEDNFVGKVDNNEDGRALFKSNRVDYLASLQAIGSITNFVADDVVVRPGTDKDTIICDIAVQPTDAMEKLYATVTVS